MHLKFYLISELTKIRDVEEIAYQESRTSDIQTQGRLNSSP